MSALERDEGLRRFATERQWEVLEVYWAEGSDRAAGAVLGIHNSQVGRYRKAVLDKAARMGYAPDHDMVKPVPDGYRLRGTSTLYRSETGEPIVQWVKTQVDAERQAEMLREGIEAMASDLPRVSPTPLPDRFSTSTMACYPIGDHHLGMYSWDEETGENYDLSIGERLLFGAIDHLTHATPASERAVVACLGDLMHYDSLEPVTPTSKNMLDSDGRFPKMVRAAIRSIRYVIQAALVRHAKVHVIIEPGNHDLAASIFLMECLSNVYEREPRVTVDTSPRHFHYVEFGRNLIGVHHGHEVKNLTELPLIMASDQPEAWGRTQHRYWWTGHLHNQRVHDIQGCTVESFRVLPPTDAWAANKGYRSARSMTAIVLHETHGEVARHVVRPAMLESTA